MKKTLQSKSNIANKIRNTDLPRTKPLMPLFELISNSIHAINEAKEQKSLKGNGKIRIQLIRNGNEETLKGLSTIDNYPVKSISVTDNGIGLNNDNLNYFIETDTDHKIEIGGKGVGRFVCLKAFKKLVVKSVFIDKSTNTIVYRGFEFRPTKEGFHDFTEDPKTKRTKCGTQILLSEFKEEYQKNAPMQLFEIARAIITHFQLYFIQNNAPEIILEDQNNVVLDLNSLFILEFEKEVQQKVFTVGEFKLTLFLTKSFTAQSHKLYFCAHHRSVKDESLLNKIVDLGKYSVKDGDKSYYYQAFVVGDVLDDNVDTERVGFNFPNDEEAEVETEDITLAKIRNGAISCIEELLADYLNKARQEKIESYKPTIEKDLPQYKNIFQYRTEDVKKLSPGLSKSKLDIELYKIEANWKLEVKETGEKLLDAKKDITNLAEYKLHYEEFLTEFNQIGQSDLARYVVHRKAVIALLEQLIGPNGEDKFTNEDIIHSIFFPIKTSSDEIPHSKQNLWLLDERLTYHSFLSSDRTFEKTNKIKAKNDNRPDLLIFNDALVFSETNLPPFNSFTIVEFKKPQRDGYKDFDHKKNPLDQVETYITDLLDGKVKTRRDREIKIDRSTPFYVYIVCDISESFEKILQSREFSKTPDGLGYFLFKDKYYSAYIEVLPFEKVLFDAKKRNRILFERLGLNTIEN